MHWAALVGVSTLALVSCQSEGGSDASREDDPRALPVEDGAQDEGAHETSDDDRLDKWTKIAPGVRRALSTSGISRIDVRGIDGHEWLVKHLEGEIEEMTPHGGFAAQEQLNALTAGLAFRGKLLATARAEIEKLRAEEALAKGLLQGQEVVYDWQQKNSDHCQLYADGYYSSNGWVAYVDAYSSLSCSPAMENNAGAYACVGSTCSLDPYTGISGSSLVTPLSPYRHAYSGALVCISGSPYYAASWMMADGQTVVATISGTCDPILYTP